MFYIPILMVLDAPKFFRDTSIENFISKPSFFAHFSAFSDFNTGLPRGMKTQKSLSLQVWSLRMRSKHGMGTKFFLRKGVILNKYLNA